MCWALALKSDENLEMDRIPEKDWKLLRSIKDDLLNSACEEIFKKVDSISKSRSNSQHSAYLELWDLIDKEDDKIGEMFNDLKRRNAVLKLVSLSIHGVLPAEQLSRFSKETQGAVNRLCEIRR